MRPAATSMVGFSGRFMLGEFERPALPQPALCLRERLPRNHFSRIEAMNPAAASSSPHDEGVGRGPGRGAASLLRFMERARVLTKFAASKVTAQEERPMLL